MVDEYQDSNNKEDLIFKLLSKNYKLDPENNPMYGDNAFVVGDVKQSIYRFRLANPKNFISTAVLRHQNLLNFYCISFPKQSDEIFLQPL